MSSARAFVYPRDVADGPQPHPGRRMTEQEFVDWCTEDTWAEWVDGEVIIMSPVALLHAAAMSFLFRLIGEFVEQHDLGTVLSEPYQIRFGQLRRRRSPDIIFISNRNLRHLREHEFDGAPDLIVEVLSPRTRMIDRRDKFNEYERVGVREYWLVDPASRSLEMYSLGSDKKFKLIPERDGVIRSKILRGLFIDPAWFSRTRFPKVSTLIPKFVRSGRGKR